MSGENSFWSRESTVLHYVQNRQKYDDLYPSEKFFITRDFIGDMDSVLDIGCAAGGMSRIMHDMNGRLHYTGLDISEDLIEYARDNLGSETTEFYCYDGRRIPFDGKKFDLVFSSGVMHLVDDWKDLFAETVQYADRYVLVDFRLTGGETYTGKMEIDFSGSAGEYLNYHVVNHKELREFFGSLNSFSKIEAFGYKRKASEMSNGVGEVYMVFFKFHIGDSAEAVPEMICHNREISDLMRI